MENSTPQPEAAADMPPATQTTRRPLLLEEVGILADVNPKLARSTMKLMQSVVNAGVDIADNELAKMVAFAAAVRDDADTPARDKIRACELLATLLKQGVDVSMYLGKFQRMDAGRPTEVVETRVFKIEFDQ